MCCTELHALALNRTSLSFRSGLCGEFVGGGSDFATLARGVFSKPRTRRRQSGKRKPPAPASLPPDAKLLVSRKMAAEMLTISIRKVDYMIADGRLLTRKIDNRVLIPVEEIYKFARSDHPRRKAG